MPYKTICIFGSRSIYTEEHKRMIYSELCNYPHEWIITSGETSGVCQLARDIAHEHKEPIKLVFANNEKYAAGKYEHRSMEIIKQSDFVLFFWDGRSKGTRNEIGYAMKFNIPHRIIKVPVDNYVFHTDMEFNFDNIAI